MGTGIQGINVVEFSKRIIKKIEKIGIEKLTLDQLLKIKGLGSAKALLILSAVEFGKRMMTEKTEILSPHLIWNSCVDICSSQREHFVVFYLDTQNKLIERQIISVGTLNASLVHPREVFEPALSLHAASIIIAHNHPSGNLEPSREDLEVTERLVNAGKLLGIDIIDHVIVVKGRYMSFKQKRLL